MLSHLKNFFHEQRILNMASTQEVIDTKWWRKPWAIQISNCKHMTYVLSKRPTHVPCANQTS
jgi:hypothetical protein